jgi:hypothetical protein
MSKGVLQAILIGAIVLLVIAGFPGWATFFAILLVLA